MCSGATLKSRRMSALEDSDPVMIGPTLRATRACIRTKEYQRHFVSREKPRASVSSIRRSTLIGWWMLVTSGRNSAIFSIPLASTWLSCTTSKSSLRACISRIARMPNVRGSGKAPVHIAANSSTSIQSRYSLSLGVRNGSSSRYRSRLGTVRNSGPGSSSG